MSNRIINSNKLYAYILFLIWPFFAATMAFLNHRQGWAKNLVWLFVAFYSYNMVISNEFIDANRYRDNFVSYSVTQEDGGSVEFYTENSGNVDVLEPFINSVLSKITSNYKLLFLVYGLIFGYFFSRNIWLLLENSSEKLLWISIPIFAIFIFTNPFWNINGFRFWTAAQVFVYGVLLFFLKRNKTGLLMIGLTTFIHFSFLLPSVVFLIYFLIGNRLTMFFYLFISSMFISELNIESVKDFFAFLPLVFENKIQSYTNQQYIELRNEQLSSLNWFMQIHMKSLKYSIYVVLLYLYINYKQRFYIKQNKALLSLFCFSLFFYSISNLISSFPSVDRFIIVASSISFGFVFLVLQYMYDRRLNLILKIATPFLLIFVLVSIRNGLDTIGITAILGNPIVAMFMDNDMALIELIK